MNKQSKPLPVRAGDIVLIEKATNHVAFEATVVSVTMNGCGQSIVRYDRLSGVKDAFPLCNVSLVASIIKAAPYVHEVRARVNIFAGQYHYAFRPEIGSGLRVGDFESLVTRALASITHVDLERDLHDTRPWELYERAGWPGRVENAPGAFYSWNKKLTVRWKVFQPWVRKNATRLILSKSEDLARRAAHKARMDADLHDAIGADMDAELELETDRELFGEDSRERAYPGDKPDDFLNLSDDADSSRQSLVPSLPCTRLTASRTSSAF